MLKIAGVGDPVIPEDTMENIKFIYGQLDRKGMMRLKIKTSI
jgi:hypothetical protein